MANAFRTALSVSTGRYWWVLVARDGSNGGVAQVLRVLRGNNLSLQGYSASSEEVSKFLSILEAEKKLVNVRLRSTEKTTFKRKPVVKFDLSAEVIP